MNTNKNTTRRPVALATALLLGTLCLTACVQDGEGTQDPATPAGVGVAVDPPGKAQVPVVFECEDTMPEPVFQACIRNNRATFPYPPVQYRHRAE